MWHFAKNKKMGLCPKEFSVHNGKHQRKRLEVEPGKTEKILFLNACLDKTYLQLGN